MMERPIIFPGNSCSLFGVLHEPSNRKQTEFGIVICHAFGEEKLWSHRVIVNFARDASNRGIPVFRFDFRGHGDSSESTAECSIDSFLDDIESAVNFFKSEHSDLGRIDLLGLRLGASLAYLYANSRLERPRLALWEPIVDGARYIQELLRINLSTQLAVFGSVQENRDALMKSLRAGFAVNVDGYLISNAFVEQCKEISLTNTPQTTRADEMLVVQIHPGTKQPDRTDLQALSDQVRHGTFLREKEFPFWREIKPFTSRTNTLIENTIDWWCNGT